MREKSGFCDIRKRARLVENRNRRLELLVGGCGIGFQPVQLRVPKHLPPIALGPTGLRLGNFPFIGRARVGAGHRRGGFRAPVVRSNRAARHQEARNCHKNSLPCQFHLLATVLGASAMRTVVPLTSESEGLTMTRSLASTPESISTFWPKSRPICTLCKSTLPSGPTTPTCRPCARNNNVFDGNVSVALGAVSRKCTWA